MKEHWIYIQQNSDRMWHKVFPIVNLCIVFLATLFNILFNGGFCVFVPWAMIVQILCFLSIIAFTWIEDTRIWQINAFVCGISIGVYFYWAAFSFAEPFVPLFPISLWFLSLLIWRNLVHPIRKHIRLWFLAGIFVCVVFAIICALTFSQAAEKIKKGEFDTQNPMTERIVGMHFRYHTRICIYDGWRPPLHDPAMILGMRLTGDQDPLAGTSLKERVALYHRLFPTLPVKARCACCVQSKEEGYFEDSLWDDYSSTDSVLNAN